MSYVEERPLWPIQSPNEGRAKQKAKRERDQNKFTGLTFDRQSFRIQERTKARHSMIASSWDA